MANRANLAARRFLTVAEVADLLRESRSAVYTRMRDGRFPYVRHGGKVLVEETELESYLAGLRHLSAEEALARSRGAVGG